MSEKWKNLPFLGRTHTLVPVPIVQRGLVPVPKVGVPVPIHQRGIGTGTEPGGTSTGASSNPIFIPLHC